jgi:hypothetical protein
MCGLTDFQTSEGTIPALELDPLVSTNIYIPREPTPQNTREISY